MEYKTTLDPAEPAPRGPVRGVSSGGGSPSQEVKTGQVSNWTQARYGVYVKSVTENEKNLRLHSYVVKEMKTVTK